MIKNNSNSSFGVGVNRAFFDVIVRKGNTYHSPHFSLKVYNAPKHQPRKGERTPAGQSPLHSTFSFVISKKVAKHAAIRNLLKRRGRHILKNSMHDMKQPVSGIFFFKKGAEGLSFDELKEEIVTLLSKAGLFNIKN